MVSISRYRSASYTSEVRVTHPHDGQSYLKRVKLYDSLVLRMKETLKAIEKGEHVRNRQILTNKQYMLKTVANTLLGLTFLEIGYIAGLMLTEKSTRCTMKTMGWVIASSLGGAFYVYIKLGGSLLDSAIADDVNNIMDDIGGDLRGDIKSLWPRQYLRELQKYLAKNETRLLQGIISVQESRDPASEQSPALEQIADENEEQLSSTLNHARSQQCIIPEKNEEKDDLKFSM